MCGYLPPRMHKDDKKWRFSWDPFAASVCLAPPWFSVAKPLFSVGSSFEIGVQEEVVLLVKLHKKIRESEKEVEGSSA